MKNVYEQSQDKPYWNLGIWIFIYLMLIAIGFYIIAVDFSFEPNQQIQPQAENLSNSITYVNNE